MSTIQYWIKTKTRKPVSEILVCPWRDPTKTGKPGPGTLVRPYWDPTNNW